MGELAWIDLIVALERAGALAAELSADDELDGEISERVQALTTEIRKAKKKIYRG